MKGDLVITGNLQYDPEAVEEGRLTLENASKVIADLIYAMGTYRKKATLDFEDPHAMDDEDYKLWTGWTKDQFALFLPYLKENGMRETQTRTLRESLAMFWIKLKTDLSFSHIATLFGLGATEAGRLRVSGAFKSVEDALYKHMVPCFLGPSHLTPDEAKKHNTAYSRAFFGDRPTTIWDGTYLYLQRSSNYTLARKLYSMQKSQNLTKFMSIVLPDGYVLDTIGPFFSNANNGDSGMTSEILQDEEYGLRQWVKQGDQAVIADKGFVNVVSLLNDLGLDCYHPGISQGGKQDTVETANQTRLVTKVRWVVEAYHGRLKKFKFFDVRKRPSYLDRYAALVKILTASLNFHRPLLIDTEQERRKHAAMAQAMAKKAEETNNPLATLVATGALATGWHKVTEVPLDDPKVAPNFPRMTEEDIEIKLTFGTYQLKLAKWYANEHLSNNGGFKISVRDINPDLVRVRLQSRYRSDHGYYAWIRFTSKTVVEWYCQCKTGARTLGCCAHVATAVWYLSCARHGGYCLPANHHHLWECIIDSKVSGYGDSDEEEAEGEGSE